ncbi:cold shock domain-containing protein [Rhodanobacter sp. T12-5]|uniref:cold shock domain-containing protein n=1 Tax=Rhodanobacter sp. T12-5 TaxID=2024611 RepID=UPI0011EF21DB|nr:cold shock domain-containing protein [Rhodanobacter sp. T12-5]KAA0068262.1 cold-shock protein [Rhodanobacter sp. T12-5]
MRTHGTLATWNDDRGFGFIEPAVGTEQIFVHISAFPRDGIRPCIGEMISFEIDLRGDGKKRAVRVMRPGSRGTAHRTRRPRPTASRQSPLTAVASLLLLAAIGWYGYSRLTAHDVTDSTPIPAPAAREVPYTPAADPTPAAPAPASRPVAPAPVVPPAVPALADTPVQPLHCDGRTYCSQMHSCAEATFFIRQCPGTRMDGNHDGVPCESQWCTGEAD